MYLKKLFTKLICTVIFLLLAIELSATPSKEISKDIKSRSIYKKNSYYKILMPVQQSVSGIVTDEKDLPLAGATVVEKGTNNGVSTDFDGNFTIKVRANAILQISYLGYTTKEISVSGKQKLKVKLSQDAGLLDDVVVVGYGTQKKSDLTGSISSVKSKNFNKGLLTNPGELLQGKMAGVNISTNSGEPGALQNVIIRGIGSLRSGTQPLYVVDGFLLDNSSNGIATNPLNFLNPYDIASIDVLKDASATAVYGSRASNGVVVITTKRGRVGKTEMNLSFSTSVSSISKIINVFNADEFRSQVVAVGGLLEDFGGNTDWQKQLTQNGISKNLNFSMSGAGSQKFSYFTSLAYQNQEGILKNNNLELYSGKLNISQKSFKGKLNIDYNLTASRTENLRPNISATTSDMLNLNPTIPAYTNGSPTLLNTNRLNPIIRNNIFSDMAINNRILASISPALELAKGLIYKLNYGVDFSATNRDQRYKPYTLVVNESNISDGVVISEISINTNQLVENTFTYQWSNQLNKLNLLAGHSYQKFLDKTRIFTYRGFADNNVDPLYQDQTSTDEYPTSVNSSAVKNELQSYFGRINYSYKDKYLVTATFRADGSSKFGANRKYGYFPSFALGWNISNEKFMENTAFNNLKLRASWGQTGNQEIPAKITQISFSEDRLITGDESFNTYPIDTQSNSIDGYPYGIVFTRLANPNLQWEVSTQIGLGIDFALLNHQLTGTLDYFNKISSNILLEVIPADPIESTPTYWDNIKDMKILNKGIELSLNYESNPINDFSYNIGGNISYIQNNVKDSPYTVLTTGVAQGAGQTGATINGYVNNEPIGVFYMLQFDGINNSGKNKFRDINNDGKILDNDRSVVGSAIPKLIYAYYLNFNYKALSLSLNFNGVAGNKVYNHTKMTLFTKPLLAKSNNTSPFAVQYPNESSINANNVSTRYLESGSFLRLNNTTFTYRLNSDKIGLSEVLKSLEFSLTGQNLFTLTKYSGFDPEINTGTTAGGIQTFGIDYFSYPKARTFLMGLNIIF
ncbi:MAG: SusC/RagA family TonB-linked outer membrane protein [Tenacibaculum sp.]